MPITLDGRVTIRAAGAEDPYGHACEPRIVRLADGAIFVAHRAGTRRDSADGRPHLVRSEDGGASWQDVGRTLDHLGTPGWDLRGAAMTALPGGDLLAAVVALDKSLDRPVYNPRTEGLVPIRNLLARSSDGGRTWSQPWALGGGPVPQTASQGLLGLPSGDILCTFETFKEYDEPGPWRYLGGLLRSGDEGRTWGDSVISAASDPDADPHDTMWWDPRIARLESGELVQFYYAFRHRSGTDGPVHAAWSRDEGRTWTAPRSTGLAGQASYPIPLEDGRVIVFQQRRGEQQAMVALVSSDGGRTFDPRSETIVYAHETPSAGGADGTLAPIDYLVSMDRFTFGHPCGVAVGPDEVVVVWYAGGPLRTAIQAARLRIH